MSGDWFKPLIIAEWNGRALTRFTGHLPDMEPPVHAESFHKYKPAMSDYVGAEVTSDGVQTLFTFITI